MRGVRNMDRPDGMRAAIIPLVGMFSLLAFACAKAQTVDAFYQGRTMSIVIGSGPGGGYDLVGRLIAQFYGQHLGAGVSIIPRNIPGASSVVAAEWFSNVAPQDGSVIGVFQPTIVLHKLTEPSAKFEPEKFGWIGRIATAPQFGLVRTDAPAVDLEAMKQKPVIIAASSPTGTGATVPWALNRLIGTQFKVIRGYTSAVTVGLAIERNEASGIGSTSWEYLETQPNWLRDGKVKIIYSIGLKRDPKIPDVPTIVELGRTEEDKATLKLLAIASTLGRSLVVTPGAPRERVEHLRKAFDRMVQDPVFTEEAIKRQIILETASGAEMANDVSDVMKTPAAIIERLARVTQPAD